MFGFVVDIMWADWVDVVLVVFFLRVDKWVVVYFWSGSYKDMGVFGFGKAEEVVCI